MIDADQLAREAVLPGSRALQALADRYGSSILLADKSLDRVKLGQIIFRDGQEKRWVEGLIHPYVRDRLMAERQRFLISGLTLVMVIPLLFEAHMSNLASEIWVVTCTAAQQLTRLMDRSGLTQIEAQARINSQMDLVQKAARANVVLDNSGSLEHLYAQIDQAVSAQTLSNRTNSDQTT